MGELVVAGVELPLMAQSRHAQCADACPLLPAERTSLIPLADGISFMIKTDRKVTECGAQTKKSRQDRLMQSLLPTHEPKRPCGDQGRELRERT